MPATYPPAHPARSEFVRVRGLNYHLLHWGDASMVNASKPPLVMVHGWMDVGASFQFVVDALHAIEGSDRWIIAPDWRGYGRSESPNADCYWFPDYLGDLDAVLDHVSPDAPVDLLGHSLGGNVVMHYAGARPARIRRLVNLEGFGMPAFAADDAPRRVTKWLDELKTPQELRPYDSLDGVSNRLMKTNPRLPEDKARWLASQWSTPETGADGQTRWRILGDPAHKRVNPVLQREEETLATYRRIAAPLLFVQADHNELDNWWRGRLTLADVHRRLDSVPQVQRAEIAGAGHMLHHDQPEALAALLAKFLA